MLLNIASAYSERQFRKKHPDSLCCAYWMASKDVTQQLGAAFARSLMWRSSDEIGAKPNTRIGLAGAPDVGKSTFIEGFVGAMHSPLFLERQTTRSGMNSLEKVTFPFANIKTKTMKQSLLHAVEIGSVLHRDALLNRSYSSTRLTNFDDPHRYGTVNVELVEHPYADANNDFDCVIMFEKRRDLSLSALFDRKGGFWNPEREMTVFATEEFCGTDRFKALQEELKPFSTFAGLSSSPQA